MVVASKLKNIGEHVALLSGPTVHSLYCGNGSIVIYWTIYGR